MNLISPMRIRISSRAASAALLLSACAVFPLAHAAGEQAEQFTPEFRQVHTTYDAKHTPKIIAPDSVKRGEWFNVTISVGAGGAHPSLQEHFVRYIALYKSGALPVDKLLTHTLKLDQINEGFDRLARGEAVRQVILF